MTRPTVMVAPDLRLRATALGRNSSAAIASRTRSSARTGTPFRYRDTVAGDTPARRATSVIVVTAGLLTSIAEIDNTCETPGQGAAFDHEPAAVRLDRR